MDNNQLIDVYYKKMLEYSIGYLCHHVYERKHEEIKELFRKIIESNNEYLLNESFLYYIARHYNGIQQLGSLSNLELNKIEVLKIYYERCINERYQNVFNNAAINKRNNVPISPNYSDVYLLLDEKIKENITMATNHIHYAINNLGVSHKFYQEIFGIILAYCHVYNKMDEFDVYYNKFINKNMTEYFELNNIPNSTIYFLQKTVSLLKGDFNKKVIK